MNTTDSRVELRFDLESSKVFGPFRKARLKEGLASRMDGNCLRVVAAEERSQWQNRQRALARLADLLREGLSTFLKDSSKAKEAMLYRKNKKPMLRSAVNSREHFRIFENLKNSKTQV